MTRLLEICIATIAFMFVSVSAVPIRCGRGVGRHGDSRHSYSLRYCRDEYDDEDEFEGDGRYYDYEDQEEEWDYNDDEDYLDGGNYDNEDTDNGEDDYYGYRRHHHEA